jgi:hypothetical protein
MNSKILGCITFVILMAVSAIAANAKDRLAIGYTAITGIKA